MAYDAYYVGYKEALAAWELKREKEGVSIIEIWKCVYNTCHNYICQLSSCTF
jgi:hypothetical protein